MEYDIKKKNVVSNKVLYIELSIYKKANIF